MTKCEYIHRCLYEGDDKCIIRAARVPEIQRRLDEVADELKITRIKYIIPECRNCRLLRGEPGPALFGNYERSPVQEPTLQYDEVTKTYKRAVQKGDAV